MNDIGFSVRDKNLKTALPILIQTCVEMYEYAKMTTAVRSGLVRVAIMVC